MVIVLDTSDSYGPNYQEIVCKNKSDGYKKLDDYLQVTTGSRVWDYLDYIRFVELL